MTNVCRLPTRNSTAEACEWLARLERGLTDSEDRQLQDWLRISPVHCAALVEAAGYWDRMNLLSRLAALFPKRDVRRARTSYQVILATATMVLIAVTVGLVAAYRSISGPPSPATVAGYHQRFETAVGENSKIQLSDGSALTLNTNTQVAVDFGPHERRIRLERGEVYFQVAHDTSRPFLVWADNKVVRAVGTTFNVEITEDKHVEVIVTEGKVLIGVSDPKASVADNTPSVPALTTPVAAGQRVLLGQTVQNAQNLDTDEIAVRLSWRDGNLVFHDVPLSDALNEIQRYTSVEFIIADDKLKSIRIVGLFKAGDVDGLLATLQKNFNISYQKTSAGKIVLRTKALT